MVQIFFARIAWAVRTDAIFFSQRQPELFERMLNLFKQLMYRIQMAIHAKTAKCKERFRMRGHIWS